MVTATWKWLKMPEIAWQKGWQSLKNGWVWCKFLKVVWHCAMLLQMSNAACKLAEIINQSCQTWPNWWNYPKGQKQPKMPIRIDDQFSLTWVPNPRLLFDNPPSPIGVEISGLDGGAEVQSLFICQLWVNPNKTPVYFWVCCWKSQGRAFFFWRSTFWIFDKIIRPKMPFRVRVQNLFKKGQFLAMSNASEKW